jgi:hypothetical protein
MADPSSGIPADGISFSKAFDRVFDAIRPDAAELRAAIECALEDQPEHDEIWARFQAAIVEVDVFFRNELAYDLSPNTLIAYQRYLTRGDEQVDPRYWRMPALVPGAADESPPIFFWKSEFDSWLLRIWGKTSKEAPRKQEVGKRPLVKKYLAEKFPQGVPDPAHCPRKILLDDVRKSNSILAQLDDATLKGAIEEFNASIER